MSNSNQLNEILKYLAQFHPIAGTIEMYAGLNAPPGWLICDGSAINRTTYSKLFEVIGLTYGAGDGNTTFNLPDMRGRTPIGVGTSETVGATVHTLGDKGGAEQMGYQPSGTVANHTLTVAQMPSHGHTLYYYNASGGQSFGYNYGSKGTQSSQATANSGIGLTGGGGAHNHGWTGTAVMLDKMQPYIAITYIISTGLVEYPEIEQEENDG